MQYNYVEIVMNGVQNRGNIYKLPSGTNLDLDYYGKEVTDGFHSTFLQNEDFKNYQKLNGNTRGYNGNVFSSAIFFDMDNENFDKVKSDTAELISQLCAYNKERLHIYFSGNKGFHIIYLCPELNIFKGEEKAY